MKRMRLHAPIGAKDNTPLRRGTTLRRGLLALFVSALCGSTAVGLDLPPPPNLADQDLKVLYEDVIIVQRKAKLKHGAILLNPGMSFDFSDAPKTLYSLDVRLGYAFSDFWEAYAVYSPFFISQDRPLAKVLKERFVIDLKTPDAKSYYGTDILWVPAYGKDSWGPHTIIRSDTFFKLSVGVINYQAATGMKYGLLLGKTFFLADYFNLRLAAGASQIESYIDTQKRMYTVGLMEASLVFYIQ